MAIRTHDPELRNAVECLIDKFPNTILHGEFTIDEYPKNYDKVNCNGVVMIVWKGKVGDDNCLNYCRESEIKRLNSHILN